MPTERGLAWSNSLVRTFMHLDPEERQCLETAREVLNHAIFTEQKFGYFVENVREWGFSLLEISQRFRRQAPSTGSAGVRDEDIDTFNRRLMNVLTTARAHTDGVTRHTAALFGPSAEQTQYVDSLWAKHYDQRLGYRAMSALRNHVQHRGLPVHGLSFAPVSDDNRFDISIDPYLRPSVLEKDGKFKGAVLQELLAMGDTVSMKPLLRDYMKSLWDIQAEVRQLIDDRLHEWMRVRERFLSIHPPGARSWAIVYVERDVDTGVVDLDPFLCDQQDYYARMRHNFHSYEDRDWTQLVFGDR